jgi:hypothetical protein
MIRTRLGVARDEQDAITRIGDEGADDVRC